MSKTWSVTNVHSSGEINNSHHLPLHRSGSFVCSCGTAVQDSDSFISVTCKLHTRMQANSHMEVSSYRNSHKHSSSAVRSTCSLSPSSLKHCRVESQLGIANRIQEESGHSVVTTSNVRNR